MDQEDWKGLTDSHCHIDHLDENAFDETFRRAQDAGVSQLVCVSVDEKSYNKTSRLLDKKKGCVVSLGMHPHTASDYDSVQYEALFAIQEYCAVGECGLDYHYAFAPRSVQCDVFEHQLEMAYRFRKPVIAHIRDAFADALFLMEKAAKKGVVGISHCFVGNVDHLRRVLDFGWFVGFSGIITFGARSEVIREALDFCPIERLLLETDSPYLAPKPFRGKPNEPAYLVEIAKKVSEVKKLSVEACATITTKTAQSLFGRPLLPPETT